MRALILSANGFEDSELFYPYYRLKEAGCDVDVAAPERGKIRGKMGYEFEANLSFRDAPAGDYDLLVLPGGKGPETVRLSEEALNITREMLNAGKPVASICHGAQILISAGVIRDRRVTCWIGIRDDVTAAGGEYSDEEVVVDGNLVSSRRPDDLPAFCRELLRLVEVEVGQRG